MKIPPVQVFAFLYPFVTFPTGDLGGGETRSLLPLFSG